MLANKPTGIILSLYFTMTSAKLPDIPYAKLGIIALESAKELGQLVDECIVEKRIERVNENKNYGVYTDDLKKSYLIDAEIVRFSDGEAKCRLHQTVRGHDIYIISDIGNYSVEYKMFGRTVSMGPDEHFQDIKRVISAISGKARRINVMMPRLYASRQDKRTSRESLDCALALQELERLGANNILTFDAHSPQVQNAIPTLGFENFYASYNIIQKFLDDNPKLDINPENLVIISPDTGAMSRAVYYANVLKLDIGLLYKQRDLQKTINGVNKIIKHEYIGSELKGKDVFVVDDMIASGGTMLDLFKILHDKGAKNIYAGITFPLFTNGVSDFEKAYKKGWFTKIYSTNLSYLPSELKEAEWFEAADMSRFIGKMINMLNYDKSVSSLFDDTSKISEYLEKREHQKK